MFIIYVVPLRIKTEKRFINIIYNLDLNKEYNNLDISS